MFLRLALAFLLLASETDAWPRIPTHSHAQKCGVERWPVKTLSDPLGDAVIRKTPQHVTIKSLTLLAPPTRKQLEQATATRFKAEMETYTVDALVVGYKAEADLDFHVVLADPANQSITMIAEFPSGNCGLPKHAQFFNGLRDAFVVAFGQPPNGKFHRLPQPVPVTITGVGFFDPSHGQDGVAPNGIELHPVLSFMKRGSNEPDRLS